MVPPNQPDEARPHLDEIRRAVCRARPEKLFASETAATLAAASSVESPDVGVDDLERRLEHVRASAAGNDAGVFGPKSMIWRVDREAVVLLGAGRALLLQLAHPWVAAGIAEHSTTLADPIGRFHRTFEVMYTLVFGNLEQAFAAARRLHRVHARIRGSLPARAGAFAQGSSYFANETAALLWVHATLVETALIAHDLVLPPLTTLDREAYYKDNQRLGAMFGIGPEFQPANWDEFASYNEAMWHSDVISVGPPARRIAQQVLGGAGHWLRSPSWHRALTAHLLPPTIREAFELPYGAAERLAAERALRWVRRIYPVLPEKLRHVGPYQEALGRLRGRAAPDRAIQLLNRAWIGRATMPRA
jgi:uncharacterized protein (DUF2236 family)